MRLKILDVLNKLATLLFPVLIRTSCTLFADLSLSDVQSTRLVFIDGVVSESLSNLEDLPKGAFVGSICSISAETEGNALLHPLERLGAPAPGTTDDLFTFLNGIGVQDAALIFVPEGVQFSKPVHVIYFSSGRGVPEKGRETSISLSSPRLLVVAGKGSQAEIVEDFVGTAGQAYWTNSVCEFSVGEGAQVSHSYIQEQGRSSVHFKQTHVSQVSCFLVCLIIAMSKLQLWQSSSNFSVRGH